MKYLFGVIGCIIVVVAVFLLVLRGLTGHKAPDPTQQVKLADYASTETVMRVTVDGPVVANQNHVAYRMTVGRTQTSLETYKTYDYELVDQRTYPNTQNAYDSFLRAIDMAGFTKGDPKIKGDERGVCANGRRIIVEILTGSSQVQRYWTTSCGKLGNFKGVIGTIQQLFVNQYPRADYNKLVNNLKI